MYIANLNVPFAMETTSSLINDILEGVVEIITPSKDINNGLYGIRKRKKHFPMPFVLAPIEAVDDPQNFYTK